MGAIGPVLIWFLIGLALIGIEFLAPGVIVIFFGVGAWVTAICSWIFPSLSLTMQLLIFLVFSVLSLVVLRKTIAKKFFQNNEKTDADLDMDFAGKEAKVVEIIMPADDGVVSLYGTNWKARSTDVIAEGTVVTVTKKEGLTLHVVPKKIAE